MTRRLITLSKESVMYSFDPDLNPVAFAQPGDLLEVNTMDALGGQVRSEEDLVTSIDFNKVNPATGPIYVMNAEPGDALVVRILKIETADKGFVITAPGAGVLTSLVKQAKTRTCYVRGDYVEFLGFKVPAWRMIGVIGVASKEKPPTGTPGKHGGNLDTKFITEGATVYLPVIYRGGLLGIGDLHAVMAHGEACVAACEVEGKVLVEIDLLKNTAPLWPVVEYKDSTYILVSTDNINNSLEVATDVSVRVLSTALGIEWHDAYMLTSLSIDLGISQLVDPKKTAWARIPKYILGSMDVIKALAELRKNQELWL
ncbi:MAG: acetamidase/formamidase family protein [Desulfurococcaceae archaeon]